MRWRSAAGRLRQALGRHGSGADAIADGFPDWNVPVLEVGVELVDADACRAGVRVVARHAVLLEERLDVLLEGGFERRGLSRRLG